MNKGFEVRFRDKIVNIAVNEPVSMSIIVGKIRERFYIHVGGLMIDTMLHHVWLSSDDLKLGDEVIIERKEIDKSSEPMQSAPHSCEISHELTDEERTAWNQWKRKRFHELEDLLSREGLI